MDTRAWDLTAADGTVLGRLERVDTDAPWYACRFAPAPAFGAVAPLFAAELAAFRREDWAAWDAAYARVEALGLALRPSDGGAPAEPTLRAFLLHVDGARAWFRWSAREADALAMAC